MIDRGPGLGATYLGDRRCRFEVWAPHAQRVELHLVSPPERLIALDPSERGYFELVADGIDPGALYFYQLDGEHDRPDPASRFQPQGVHGPSQVVDPCFAWDDEAWFGLPLEDYILYELHVGLFTAEGTFEAIIPRLGELRELGVTALELMPVAQFPGTRNWGYDGVFPYAVQNSYGGPVGLKRLVSAAHQHRLAVVLDVVYNHLGPEGNYLADYGPYFTSRYRTPWGDALNFDGPHSDEVRRFFLENAAYWLTEFHMDTLRIDAVHAIYDYSARPFLQELAETVRDCGSRVNRRVYAFPESDLNDARLIRATELGGFGFDAQWNDDFHHALRAVLTGTRHGYYQDFGSLDQLAKALREGFVYSGQYSQYRRRRHGASSRELPASRFIVFTQNHDQVGNRMLGERLSHLVSFEDLKLAAGILLLSPCLPLLFMGEEYAETAPFLYFICHSEAPLIEAVRQGRRREFTPFHAGGEPPDPQDETTFLRSKLNPELRQQGHHGILREFYRELIRLRRKFQALAVLNKEQTEVLVDERRQLLSLRRWERAYQVFAVFHFGAVDCPADLPVTGGLWHKLIDSADPRWNGQGPVLPRQLEAAANAMLPLPARSFALYSNRTEEQIDGALHLHTRALLSAAARESLA